MYGCLHADKSKARYRGDPTAQQETSGGERDSQDPKFGSCERAGKWCFAVHSSTAVLASTPESREQIRRNLKSGSNRLLHFCFQTTATSPFLVSTPSTLSRHRRAPILNLSQNDAKAKLKKTGQENMDLQRRSNQLECAHRVLEARARAAPTVASPATPAAFTSTASGRSVTKQSWSRKGSACLTLSVKIDSVGWQHCIRTCSCSATCAPKTGSPYTSKHKDECRRATRIVAKGTVSSAFFPLVGRPSTIHRKTVVEWLSRLV